MASMEIDHDHANRRQARHHPRRFLVRQGRFVRPLGSERVIYVGYLQDARQQRNVLAPKVIGIPGAVPVLVVVADDRQHCP